MRSYNSLDDPPVAQEQEQKSFIPLILLSQILGITCIIMTLVWMSVYFGGFDWSDGNKIFNYHPVFMIVGMIFCYGDAILAFRVFRKFPKIVIKVMHAVLNIFGLLFSVIGLKSAFDSHTFKNLEHLYSIHSWIGFLVIIFFSMQWVLGFLAFLVPATSLRLRQKYMPTHTAAGLFIFILSLVACLTGIAEKNIFSSLRAFSPSLLMGNFLGIFLISFACVILYILNRDDYKRSDAIHSEQEHVNSN